VSLLRRIVKLAPLGENGSGGGGARVPLSFGAFLIEDIGMGRRIIGTALAFGACWLGVWVAGCGDRAGAGAEAARCDDACGTVVVAAVGEPSSILPPLVVETVGRDIGDLVWERLARLEPGGATVGTAAFRPELAARWERVDSTGLRFHLRPGARWQDGKPVTAEDVVFSFAAFADSTLDSPARPNLEGVSVTAEDSATVLVRFRHPSSEMLYDATYHVRILPKHVWGGVPFAAWAADSSLGRLVGSGPYRVREWTRGQHLTLEADSGTRSAVRRVVWRFAADPEAALNLVLGHEADLLETVIPPTSVPRVERDTSLRAVPYASAAYGFLAFNVAGRPGKAPSPLADRAVRRALTEATDRAAVAHALFGPAAKAPPGPMSQLLWIWSDDIRTLPYDTAAAARMLDEAGWKRGADGVRRKNGAPLAFDMLAPATSGVRRRLLELLQESWRRDLGVKATVTVVDFPVFQGRLAKHDFDAYAGSYLDEPSPRGLAEQWTKAGWGSLNYGRYGNPAFDSLFAKASRETDPTAAKAAYAAAMDTLDADAPAIFLFAPTNVAAVNRRITGVRIDPYSWLIDLPKWGIDSTRSR
jgi:peptide/nickel transport system substrate-binding protein